MAGGWAQPKRDTKNKSYKNSGFSNEVLKDSYSAPNRPISSESKPTFSLRGVLGLGQSVELNKAPKSTWNQEFLLGANHLAQQEKVLLSQKHEELKREIKSLQEEIKKLVKVTENVDKSVEVAADTLIIEANIYQLNFLERLKNFVIQIRRNVSQAGIWLETFQSKKKKKNYFWNTVKNRKKKGGGEQYLFSNEHSTARSVN
jgi:hypothetical protein